MRKALVSAAVIAVAGFGLSGCVSLSGQEGGASSGQSEAHPVAPVQAQSGGSSAARGATTSALCQSSDLDFTWESSEYAGGGNGFAKVTNTGSESCTLDGHPGFQMMTSGINEIPTTNEPLGGGAKPVDLQPGAQAGVEVRWSGQGTCVEKPVGLIMTLPHSPTPDDGHPLEVAVNTPDGRTQMLPCDGGKLQVGAFGHVAN